MIRMITINGYSKDPNIIPDGIVVTFGREMMNDQGGLLCFIRNFEQCMTDENSYWMHKLKNRPTMDNRVLYVYVIVCKRIYCRCFYGGYNTDSTIGYTADGKEKIIEWPKILLCGPIEKAPYKIVKKGFQGFRYCTKLF